jgi:hypothetical protein
MPCSPASREPVTLLAAIAADGPSPAGTTLIDHPVLGQIGEPLERIADVDRPTARTSGTPSPAAGEIAAQHSAGDHWIVMGQLDDLRTPPVSFHKGDVSAEAPLAPPHDDGRSSTAVPRAPAGLDEGEPIACLRTPPFRRRPEAWVDSAGFRRREQRRLGAARPQGRSEARASRADATQRGQQRLRRPARHDAVPDGSPWC